MKDRTFEEIKVYFDRLRKHSFWVVNEIKKAIQKTTEKFFSVKIAVCLPFALVKVDFKSPIKKLRAQSMVFVLVPLLLTLSRYFPTVFM